MKKVAIWIIFLLAFLSRNVKADEIDNYVQSEMKKQKIPGVAIAIVKAGNVAGFRSYGLANIEHNVAVKPETIFQSGSVGKQFTATAVMMLNEDGKLRIDDPISQYIDVSPPSWKGITIRHLLTHTSGITDYTEAQVDLRRDYKEEDLVKIIAGLPVQFEAGTKWSYSNSGYLLLGAIIRKTSGKFYGDFLQERVFRPLGMTSTRIINEADIIQNRAAGYRLVEGQIKNQEWVAPTVNTTADGSLYINAVDMAKWDRALYGEELVKKSSLNQMWTGVTLNNGVSYPYGFGWSFDYQRGHKIIGHGGHWQGFSTAIARYVDDRLTIIVLANLADISAGTLAHNVAGLYEAPLRSPRFLETNGQVSPVKEERLKTMLSELSQETSAPSTVIPGFYESYEKSDRDEAAKILKNLNSFEFITCDDVKNKGISRYGTTIASYCYYKITSGEDQEYATFALTPDNKLAELSFETE